MSKDTWAHAVLKTSMLKTSLKLLVADTVMMVRVVNAIIFVAESKRDAYAAAHKRIGDESYLFNWMAKNPVLAGHVTLLNSKFIDLNAIPLYHSTDES